jgi:hypothetical protein
MIKKNLIINNLMKQLFFKNWFESTELPLIDQKKVCQSVCPNATVVWLIELKKNWRDLNLINTEIIDQYLENDFGKEYIEGLQKYTNIKFYSPRVGKNINLIPQEEECRGFDKPGVKPIQGFISIRPRKKEITAEHGYYVNLHNAIEIPAEAIENIKAIGGCALTCLHLSGGQVSAKTVGAYRKTDLYKRNKDEFYNITLEQYFKAALKAAYEKCMENKEIDHYAIRLNGTSDIMHYKNEFVLNPKTLKTINSYAMKKFKKTVLDIENIEDSKFKFFDIFNLLWNEFIRKIKKCDLKNFLHFYDYTAIPLAMKSKKELPERYHITFSVKEGNLKEVMEALKKGIGVALPIWIGSYKKSISKISFPKYWYPQGLGKNKYRIIDGDSSDARFLDKKIYNIKEKEGYVVGLRAKGKLEDVLGYDTGFAERMIVGQKNPSKEDVESFCKKYPIINSQNFEEAKQDYMQITQGIPNPRFDQNDPAVKKIIFEQMIYFLRRENCDINNLGPLKSKDWYDKEAERNIGKLVNISDISSDEFKPGTSAKTDKGKIKQKMAGTSSKVEKGEKTINVKTNQLNMLPHTTFAALRNKIEEEKNKFKKNKI